MMIAEMMPVGLRGLLVAAFLAAFMSTMDTHLCWGASYLVQDVYRRFVRPEASEREFVLVSRMCIVLMAVLAGFAALMVQNIAEVWLFLITLGAGLGSVSAVRWYWWRVTAWAELAAIAVSTVVAIALLVLFTPQSTPGLWQIILYLAKRCHCWLQCCRTSAGVLPNRLVRTQRRCPGSMATRKDRVFY